MSESSGPAPGLGLTTHRSLSQEKIDHLMSVPVEAPVLMEMNVERTPEPRYSYDIKAASVTSHVGITNPQWRPLHLRTPFILANVIVLLFCAFLVELLYFINHNVHGMVPSHFVLTHDSFVPYLTVLPGM